jgi:glycosyltransferase involved in cell wall biosynthesis
MCRCWGPAEMPPRVSICIPAYKAERYLEETLASVRAQTFTEWELIIVEDGSHDGTEHMIRRFREQGPQPVRYFRHDHNQGLSATRNTGFAQAEANLLALLDADDVWRPTHLETCLATLTAESADFVFGGCQIFDSDTRRPIAERTPPAGAMADFPLSLHDGRVVIQPSTVLVKQSWMMRCGGFDRRFPICNDLECWFRIAKLGARFAYTGEITCDYRKHRAALSKRSADLVAECAQIHRLHRDWPAIPAAQRRVEMWRHHRNAARMLARQSPLRALALMLRGNALRAILPIPVIISLLLDSVPAELLLS